MKSSNDLEFRFGFAGKSDDESRAQRDSRNPSAQSSNQLFDMLARSFPPHPSQHRVVDMLQRNIDVARNLVALRDGLDQFVAPVRRMRVKQAHPEFAFDLLEFREAARPESVREQNRPADAVRLSPSHKSMP